MKRINGMNISKKVLRRRLANLSPSRLMAVLIGSLVVVVAIPFFTAGYSSDVVLQVPSHLTQGSAEDFLPVSANMDTLTDRNSDGLLSEATTDTTTTTKAASKTATSAVSKSILDNTVTVTEEDSNTGVPVELLDPSQFASDNTEVYASVDGVNVRTSPKDSADLVSALSYADVATRVGIGSAWSKVELSDGSIGYVLSSFLTEDYIAKPTAVPTQAPTAAPTSAPEVIAPQSAPDSSVSETEMSGTFYAIGVVNVRSGPGIDYDLTRTLALGDGVDVVAKTDNGWYKTVKGTYVLAQLLSASKPEVPNTPAPSPSEPEDSTSDFVSFCRSFIGVPYVWAGGSPSGFDCSGFVSYVYSNFYGVSLPHLASDIATMGTGVDASNIQVGDVICYDYNGNGVSHVSVYIGDGAIVHASSSRASVVEGSFSTSSVVTIRRFN